MHLSTHYYVLTLGSVKSTLYEAFRDTLIMIQNQGFPVVVAPSTVCPGDEEGMQDLVRTVDERFGHYFADEPLTLIVVGESDMQSAFNLVTDHSAAVVGRVAGDHSDTDVRDLGAIVWSVVKGAMSGVVEVAMQDLEASEMRGEAVSGLEAVTARAGEAPGGKLLVEDDYHVRGTIGRYDSGAVISPDVDVRQAFDDVVDAVAEKVLSARGNVIFMPAGSLRDRGRIVLIVSCADSMQPPSRAAQGPGDGSK